MRKIVIAAAIAALFGGASASAALPTANFTVTGGWVSTGANQWWKADPTVSNGSADINGADGTVTITGHFCRTGGVQCADLNYTGYVAQLASDGSALVGLDGGQPLYRANVGTTTTGAESISFVATDGKSGVILTVVPNPAP